MGAALRLLEGALLVGLGAFMVGLSRSSAYWQLLNPKYAWLTGFAGAVLALLGLVHSLHSGRRGRIGQGLALALALGLGGAAVFGPAAFAPPAPVSGYTGGSLTRAYDDENPPDRPTMTEDGVTYTRLNLAELLAGEQGGWTTENGRYAVQGAVLRTPELDRAGYIAVARLYVYCCFADAVGVVVLVGVNHPERYRAGSWVRVLGTLRSGAPFRGRTFDVTGALTSARSERFLLDAASVTEARVEGVPFILDIRQAPPFAY